MYTLDSIISTSLMLVLLLYPETLGHGCSQFYVNFLLSRFLQYTMGFDIEVNYQRIQTTCSHYVIIIVIIVIIVVLILYYSKMSHATLSLFHHTSKLTPHNFFKSCILLPHA